VADIERVGSGGRAAGAGVAGRNSGVSGDVGRAEFDVSPQPVREQHGAGAVDRDEYTNLEEYLNGTDPNVFIDYRNLENNVDTISFPIEAGASASWLTIGRAR
jgi:hypothetical protein